MCANRSAQRLEAVDGDVVDAHEHVAIAQTRALGRAARHDVPQLRAVAAPRVATDAEERPVAAAAAALAHGRRELGVDGSRAVVEARHDRRAHGRDPRHAVDVQPIRRVARPVIVLVTAGVEEEDGRAGGIKARVVRRRERRAVQIDLNTRRARSIRGGRAQTISGVDAADGQLAVAHAPDHVEVEHGHGLREWQRGVAHVVAGSDETELLGAE